MENLSATTATEFLCFDHIYFNTWGHKYINRSSSLTFTMGTMNGMYAFSSFLSDLSKRY